MRFCRPRPKTAIISEAAKRMTSPRGTMTLSEFRELHDGKIGKRKYKNVPTTVDGMRFDSKAEARRYGELKALKASGHIIWFIRQPRFDLPGGVIYRGDFLVVWNPNLVIWKPPRSMASTDVTIEDVKGFLTPSSKMKIKMVEAIYGIKVEIVK